MKASLTSLSGFTAFCETCPAPGQVSAFLEQWGFRLSFEMGVDESRHYEQLPSLPAQFHYANATGIEVMYLAGKDHPLEEGVQFPVHASRFWVYPGKNGHHFGQICHALATRWSLRWQCSELVDRPSPTRKDVA